MALNGNYIMTDDRFIEVSKAEFEDLMHSGIFYIADQYERAEWHMRWKRWESATSFRTVVGYQEGPDENGMERFFVTPEVYNSPRKNQEIPRVVKDISDTQSTTEIKKFELTICRPSGYEVISIPKDFPLPSSYTRPPAQKKAVCRSV